jgi:putative transposase
MPIPSKYLVDFNELGIYHVFNRTNNKEKLFLNDENHYFFLRKYEDYLSPFLETYAWCLLPNHFHFLVRIKSVEIIKSTLNSFDSNKLSITEKKFLENSLTLSELIESSFKRFFQSYALAFNKVHKRKGNLFYKPFKRLEILQESHFIQAVIYIHANAVRHNIIKDFTTWKWSSYHATISDSFTNLLREEVFTWFGGKEQFIKTHREMTSYYYEDNVSIEA